jgi:hypothetical protein
MSILIGFVGAVKVFTPPARPPITCPARFVTIQDVAFLLFPLPPVIIGVAAFNLMGGCGCSP